MKGKKSAKLLKSWVTILFFVGIPTGIYTHYYAYLNGLSEAAAPLWLEILLALVVPCAGLPLLYGAMYYAKQEKEKRTGRIAAFLFVHHLLCLVGELISRIM